MWCVSALEICCASSQIKTIYDCDATILLNVYIYLVFVGGAWLALVPSNLPHLTNMNLVGCFNVCVKYLQELVAAVPELKLTPGVKL
jgi:hypothetical protein